MNNCPVIFIAYKGYDNLGIGYMQSVLSKSGYKSKVLDLSGNKNTILKRIKDLNPPIVGFSVIFEENLENYCDLVSFLRRGGITCHFTAGGHYASLKYGELFEYIPGLDSIVRFEGEYTLLELANNIYNGSEWRNIDGLAYRDKGGIIVNKLRPFENDLDKFPFPVRQPLKPFAMGRKFATLIAGRGCIHNCSFCNSRKFYEGPQGALKRLRSPENVAEEMLFLYNKKKCRIFLFMDDDFPVTVKNGSSWIQSFCEELNKKELSDKILWKICCRTDEIDEELFLLMKKNGLFMVFIGIEDGTDDGLMMMNKGVTAAQNSSGIEILQKLGIGIDFGFMLFHPSTTYGSLNENLSFLRESFSYGANPVSVTKMIPSYETRIERDLKKQGRLKVSGYINDYDFHDESMNKLYDFIFESFADWRNYPYGVVSLAKLARNNYLVFFRYNPGYGEILNLYRQLERIVSDANKFYLDTMKELAFVFESGEHLAGEGKLPDKYRKKILHKYQSSRERIIDNIDTLMLYSLVFNMPE
jgi:anaerobic magnesium-protoporphyrin IX monomethyl ester cyclase